MTTNKPKWKSGDRFRQTDNPDYEWNIETINPTNDTCGGRVIWAIENRSHILLTPYSDFPIGNKWIKVYTKIKVYRKSNPIRMGRFIDL